MNEINMLAYQLNPLENSTQSEINSLNPMFKTVIDGHLKVVLNNDDTQQRIDSWLELEQMIKEIFLVYDRQVKLDKDNKNYYMKLFYKMLEQRHINGHDPVAMMRLLKTYPAKEAAFVMHFFNLAYLDYNISDWLKHSPSRIQQTEI